MEKIETNHFILRKVEENDAEEMYKILRDKDVNANLNMEIHKDISDTKKLIKEYLEENEIGNKYPFAILDKVTQKFLGVFLIKLDLFDEDCFEFTIYLKQEQWGKGIYTEILPYMIKFAFEEIGTGNFRGFVMEKNVASSKVLEKYNFELEKIFNVPNIEGKIKSFFPKDLFFSNNIT